MTATVQMLRTHGAVEPESDDERSEVVGEARTAIRAAQALNYAETLETASEAHSDLITALIVGALHEPDRIAEKIATEWCTPGEIDAGMRALMEIQADGRGQYDQELLLLHDTLTASRSAEKAGRAPLQTAEPVKPASVETAGALAPCQLLHDEAVAALTEDLSLFARVYGTPVLLAAAQQIHKAHPETAAEIRAKRFVDGRDLWVEHTCKALGTLFEEQKDIAEDCGAEAEAIIERARQLRAAEVGREEPTVEAKDNDQPTEPPQDELPDWAPSDWVYLAQELMQMEAHDLADPILTAVAIDNYPAQELGEQVSPQRIQEAIRGLAKHHTITDAFQTLFVVLLLDALDYSIREQLAKYQNRAGALENAE